MSFFFLVRVWPMSFSSSLATSAGLFLRYCSAAHQYVSVLVVVYGTWVLLSIPAGAVSISAQLWVVCMLLSLIWTYARDKPLRGAFEAAPARQRQPVPASGLVEWNYQGTSTQYKQLGLVEPRGLVNTVLAFNTIALWVGFVLNTSAVTALVLWVREEEKKTFSFDDFVFFGIAFSVSLLGMLAVEFVRMIVMHMHEEATLLSALWNLDVEARPLSPTATAYTTRDEFIGRRRS